MASPDSWIDLPEVARLVRRLLPSQPPAPDRPPALSPSPEPLVSSLPKFPWDAPANATFPELDDLEAGPENDFPLSADPDLERLSSLSGEELKHRATRAMQALRAVATERPPAPAPPEPPRPASPQGNASGFRVPEATLRERLLAYANWVTGVTGCISLRIVDPQGYSLLEREGENDPGMVDCTLKLIATLEATRARIDPVSPGSGLYLPLGDDEWLGVLECETAAGRICLSLITRAPLAKAAALELTESLRRTVDPL
ncbi:MAG: hypothetical protein KGS60_19245 [Verrucomicrobia bacterium]|nr:hypothetical protein [Verrucomicrobiota bacterium]